MRKKNKRVLKIHINDIPTFIVTTLIYLIVIGLAITGIYICTQILCKVCFSLYIINVSIVYGILSYPNIKFKK